ncbi:unnamed protein product [Adineta steineri]|nr:unnamed protein product [Adineta steineri]
MRLTEAEFNFESLQQFHSQFGFCSEDTTGVIRKAQYDVSTNSFIGFATPIINGIPVPKHYQPHTFDDFKTIYNTNEIAPLPNLHIFQNIPTEDNAINILKLFLLSAHGVNNKFTTVDILRRWMYIFENCLDKDVRVIGFSTDADNKYNSAMHFASNFFASLPNFKLDHHKHAFKINTHNDWTWFFLNRNQVFVFLQDPSHLVTKWRNRLSSTTAADLCFGTNETVVYLILLKMIVKAYIDKSTSITELEQQHLPKQALISTHLFNSQGFESLFKDARSLSSTFSTTVNFTVKIFIRRSQKLSILNQMGCNQNEKDLSFPIHHKQKLEHSLVTLHQLDEIDTLNIEQIIAHAYDQAIHIVKHSKMLDALNQHGINSLDSLSIYIYMQCIK